MDFVEGSLWKQKKTMTGFKWKKRWVRADKNKLIQWHSDVKPGDKVKPKHVYNLQKCIVREIRTNKPYAFSVTDNTNGDAIIFAASKVAEYDTWLSILMRDDISEDKFETIPTKAGNTQTSIPVKDPGPIPRFFASHNVSKSSQVKEIKSIDFPDAVKAAGLTLSPTETALAIQTLLTPKGTILETDFIKWLAKRDTSLINDPPSETPENENHSDAGSKITASTIDSKKAQLKKKAKRMKPTSYILGQDEIMRLNHFGSNWLNIGESSLLAGIVDVNYFDIQKMIPIIGPLHSKTPDIGNIINEFPWPKENDNPTHKMGVWNAIYQDLYEEVSQIPIINQTSEHFHELFSLISLQGMFIHHALTGVQLIVDSYSLPPSMKTTNSLISLSSDSVDTDKDEEILYYNGLIFRISGCRNNDRDHSPTDSRTHFVLSNEEIARKIYGNEIRGLNYVQKGLASLNLSEVETNDILRPTVLMTILIDYCGFRFQVFTPIAIDEQHTLVYGYSTTENMFIDANPTVHSLVPMIAKQLNLSLTRKKQFICPTTLYDYEPQDLIQRPSEVLSKDLQFHILEHNRVYLINFLNFLPPDLPREMSTDILTKTLRPEYIHEYSEGSISSDVIRSDLENQLGGNSLNTTINSDNEAEDDSLIENQINSHNSLRPTILLKPLKPILNWIRAATSLREDLIPDIVYKLDNLTVLPLDSYGLTKFLHNHGINIRYIGDIYLRTQLPHVKDLILCEAISRSCKTLLNQSLKGISRSGRAQTLIAEQRKRSKLANYIEHQGKVLHSKLHVIVDLFNLLFGYGIESELFWSTTLPAVVYYKYSIILPNYEDVSLKINFPQLFHTIQLQTGYFFHNDKTYQFHTKGCEKPFHISNIEHITPLYKYQLSIPGIFSTIEKSAEAFLASKMYNDALNAYKLKLSFLNIIQSNNTIFNYKLQYEKYILTYLISLCYYYLNKFTIASSLIKTTLEDISEYNPICIPYITLLMCIEFKSCNIQNSLSYYELIHKKILYHYGFYHPLHCQLYNTLSDLYYLNKMYLYSKVMLLHSLNYCQSYIGMNSLLYGTITYKLGVIDLHIEQYLSAEEYFHQSILVFNKFTSLGGVFQYELALCYHGLSYVHNMFEQSSKAINYSLKSIGLTVIEENYISIDTVNTIIFLGELYDKQNLSEKSIELYCDAWNIILEYQVDYDVSSILLTLLAKIVNSYLNTQILSIRMLFDSLSSSQYDTHIKQREWVLGCQYITQQVLIQSNPLNYITNLLNEIIQGSSSGLSMKSSSNNNSNQMNIIGVPLPTKRKGSISGVDSTSLTTGSGNKQDKIGASSQSILETLEQQQQQQQQQQGSETESLDRIGPTTIPKLSPTNAPIEVQAAILLTLILELI